MSSEQWIVRVAGKEYGPADLPTLREWKEDGRVLSTNDARLADNPDSDGWIRAGEIPGLFPAALVPPPIQFPDEGPPPPGILRICFDSVALYIRGFFLFLGLTLLVVIPSVLAQMTGIFVEGSNGTDLDARKLLAGGVSFCMLLLTLAAWPIYIAGIQILTGELALGRRLPFFELLNRSLKFWPRVAALCVFVYMAFAFWTVLPMGVVVLIGLGGPSALSFFLILGIGVIQVWIVSRLFINFLFWQQTAVLDEYDVAGALRESRLLARSGQEVAWYKRPLWQGVFVSSLWFLFVFGLNIPTLIPAFREYFHMVSTVHDPQALVQAMSEASKTNPGFDRLSFALGLLESLLRPLLGVAFVLIFFAAKSRGENHEPV